MYAADVGRGRMGRVPVLADAGQKTLKRVNLLLKDIQRNVFEGIGEPEPLKTSCPAGGVGALTA